MKHGRILGIDYGTKRIGVAVSDPTRLITRGVATLANNKNLMRQLVAIIDKEEVGLIVVGMPYAEDGGKGKKACEVENFITMLKKHTSVDIETWDESFSSVLAHQTFIDTGMKKTKRQQKARIDMMAARLMLQEYLDARRTSATG